MKRRKYRSAARRDEIAEEALLKAQAGQSLANYAPIFEGFAEKGIPLEDIKPRENVFTFHAWHALGRHVRKGEHGVKVATMVSGSKTDKETGESVGYRLARTTTVFHISQTEPIEGAHDERSNETGNRSRPREAVELGNDTAQE